MKQEHMRAEPFKISFGLVLILTLACSRLFANATTVMPLIALQRAPDMNADTEILDYSQREAIVDSITRQFAAHSADGLKLLRSYDENPSQDLRRDLLAMAWRIALKSNDLAVRRDLVDYLLNMALRGTPFLQGQALKFLLDFSARDFDQRAEGLLQALPLSGDYGSEKVRLMGVADLQSRAATLREIAGTNWNGLKANRLYASREWAASLALARFGDNESTQRVIKQVNNEPDIVLRATKLFDDLAYTRQALAFDALRSYLHSQARLPRIKDSVPGTPEAVYAATLFARHIDGCPVVGPDVFEKDVPAISQWADRQTAWKFRELSGP